MTRFINSINLIGLWGAISSLVLLVFIALGEMLMRSFWGTSLGYGTEFSGYLVAFSFFLGSGWALANDGHIRVDLLSDKLPKKYSLILDILASLIGIYISFSLAMSLFEWTAGSYERGSVSYFQSETPLWIPQLIFGLGPLFLSFGLLSRARNKIIKLIEDYG